MKSGRPGCEFAATYLNVAEAMDREILKQLLRGAIEGSELPALSRQEAEFYVIHLRTRGILAKATYWERDGDQALAFFRITNRSPKIDAKIVRILKEDD
jgi:hypothetical protein